VITVGGYNGSQRNDVFLDIYDNATDVKIGQSTFHLSCSDIDMNSADDCGKPAGNAKGTVACSPAPCVNAWTFEGMAGGGKTLDCAYLGGTGTVTYPCEVTNKSTTTAVNNVSLIDAVTDSGGTTNVPIAGPFNLAPNETMTFDRVDAIGENTTNIATAQVGADPLCKFDSNNGVPVTVTVATTPPLCPTGAASLAIKGKDVSWDLTDPKDGQKSEIMAIIVSWPTGTNGALKEVKLSKPKIFSGSLAISPATINAFSGSATDRSVDDGRKEALKFSFVNNAASGPYDITVNFTNGCSVHIAKP